MSCDIASGNHTKKGTLIRIRYRYTLFIITIFFGSFLILSNKHLACVNNRTTIKFWKTGRNNGSNEKSYTINTEGCRIPAMEPVNENVRTYIFRPSRLKSCNNPSDSLLGYNQSFIWVKADKFHHYKITPKSFNCCYQNFERPNSVDDVLTSNSHKVDNRATYDKCIKFKKYIKVHSEFVRVTCRSRNKDIYKQYFAFTPLKAFTEHDHKQISENKSAYNVLILGIDGVSRLNFHRTMPKTLQYLKNKGAVELLGYNKVADNTFPNVMPMLVGASATELKKVCLPHSHSYFDNCPFIWEEFKQAGYYTALGEDCSNIGTFNYQKRGFIGTPTDYYLHTFVNEAESNVGSNKDFNSYLCMNDRYFYKVLLDYISDLTSTLNKTKLFGLFWEVSMSHDYLNYPMIMDKDYESFFEKLDKSGYLNETIIFLISDHGIRWSGIRKTLQGRLEERLPFTYVLTPPSFRDNYSLAFKNLQLNSERLTTPYDIHATLSQLLDLNEIEDKNIEAHMKSNYAQERGISLFVPIPTNRTCKIAGIDDHWCTCYEESEVDKKSDEVVAAAAYLLEHMNKLLKEYKQCAQLKLSEIMYATELNFSKYKFSSSWREFMVVIKTSPGNGMFEATLQQDLQRNKWSLSGTASRINLYGELSKCVHDTQLKLYCFCLH